MKKNIKAKAIIFDMDGVITNSMPYHYKAWIAVLRENGIKGLSRYDIYEREGQAGINTISEIFSHNNISLTKKQKYEILRNKEKLFKKIVKTRFINGARPFIRYLKKKKFLLSLVTGTSRHEIIKILPQATLDYFNSIVAGDDVKKGKPNPEPYLKALKQLRVFPHQAIVIENAPFGIESAKKSGLLCLAIKTSLPKQYLKKADMIFDSIAKLRQKIEFHRNSR